MGSVEDLNIAKQLGVQALAIVITIIYCGILSFVILKAIDMTIGLRIGEDDELTGLDLADHGEVGYDL